jgi:UV DNA damage endonuclease
MRIGYPCINRSIGCRGNRTFRLSSYSEKRLLDTARSNIACLKEILEWNLQNHILFFRITSDLIPFASHPVCTVSWQRHLGDELALIGDFIAESGVRISMHPDQFIVLNSPDEKIVERSIAELVYHADVIDLLGLGSTAKIQLHGGGLYGNPAESMARFIRAYDHLDPGIRRYLVLENDDRRFASADCLKISEQTGIPVLLDVFHHSCHNKGEGVREILPRIGETWKADDGIMMVDYSSQHPVRRRGSHAEQIDLDDFRSFLEITQPFDMDIMLEIKDKEKSALAAVSRAMGDPRFV